MSDDKWLKEDVGPFIDLDSPIPPQLFMDHAEPGNDKTVIAIGTITRETDKLKVNLKGMHLIIVDEFKSFNKDVAKLLIKDQINISLDYCSEGPSPNAADPIKRVPVGKRNKKLLRAQRGW